MPTLPFDSTPAPTGFNSADDPVSLPADRATMLQNLSVGSRGVLRGSGAWRGIGANFSAKIDGAFWYRGVTATSDRFVVISSGMLYLGIAADPYSDVPTFAFAPCLYGGGFTAGVPVRGVMFSGELILVQEGIQPRRFDGNAVYQLGITPPNAPTVVSAPPASGGTQRKKGSVTYKYTLADARLRESSPSNGTTLNYTTATYKTGQVTVDFGSDPQVTTAYIYANTAGGAIWYRIATLTKASGVRVWEDNVADSIVNTGAIMPDIGENDPPDPASCVAVHKNYLFMNSTTSPADLQISNLASPTQWAVVAFENATDGGTIQIISDQADLITALIPFGSLLATCKRGNLGFVWGDTASEFVHRPVHARGTTSPDSIVRCDNEFRYLLEDNIYATDFQGGFVLNPVASDFKNVFQELRRSAAGRTQLTNAKSAFLEQVQYCSIGSVIYAFDFSSGGWTTYKNSQAAVEADVTALCAVVNAGRRPYLFVGFAGGTLKLLEIDTTEIVYGMIYRTRALGVGERVRTRRKRAKRVTVYGSGDAVEGTITFYADNKSTETYPIVTPIHVSEEQLVMQECTGSVCGNALSNELRLSGRNVEIREDAMQFCVLD